ncbi:MAG TPA: hypothetical protein VGD02_01620, partial [Gemmatimonadaceae bacterium]
DPRGAAIEFRKHLGWYVKGVPGSAELRRKLHAVVSLSEVEDVFADYLANPHRHEDAAIASTVNEDDEQERAPAAA